VTLTPRAGHLGDPPAPPPRHTWRRRLSRRRLSSCWASVSQVAADGALSWVRLDAYLTGAPRRAGSQYQVDIEAPAHLYLTTHGVGVNLCTPEQTLGLCRAGRGGRGAVRGGRRRAPHGPPRRAAGLCGAQLPDDRGRGRQRRHHPLPRAAGRLRGRRRRHAAAGRQRRAPAGRAPRARGLVRRAADKAARRRECK